MVKGFICGPTRRKVDWNHFDTECDHGPQGLPAASPFLARQFALHAASDVRHQTLDATATGIMDCTRHLYMSRTIDYWVDPDKIAVMIRGTALHEQMARTLDPEVWSTESTDPIRHDLRGKIGAFNVSALADAWKRDLSHVIDGKFPKDWSVKFRSKDGKARVEHAAQLNIERLLLAQQPWAITEGFNVDTVRLTVWDHGIGATEGPLMQAAAYMTEDQILGLRPWGAATTIADHATLLTQIREEDAKLAPGDAEGRERLAASIPLVGQAMFNGNKCAGCELKEQCDGLVRKYGVPQ